MRGPYRLRSGVLVSVVVVPLIGFTSVAAATSPSAQGRSDLIAGNHADAAPAAAHAGGPADGPRGGPAPAHAGPTDASSNGWPTHCLDRVPRSPADYQEVFDHRTDGWAGADGAGPIKLPDGRVLWMFGDTLAGQVDENNALRPGWNMPHNSFQLQDGRCFTPLIGGTQDNPSSYMPDEDGMVFWPAGGYVDQSVEPAVLRMVSTGICIEPDGWRACEMRVHTMSLPDLEVMSVDPVPFDATVPDMPAFGFWVFHDKGMVYLYGPGGGFQAGGPSEDGQYPPGIYLARVRAERLVDGPWEYWTGSGPKPWSRDVGKADALSFDEPANPRDLSIGGVVRWGAGYLLTGKMGYLWVFGTEVYGWYSESPAGPWKVVRVDGEPADLVPEDVSFPQGRWIYGGFLVTNVPGTSPRKPMVVFSTNGLGCDGEEFPCTPDNDIGLNVLLYGPHLYTPRNLPPWTGPKATEDDS
ncbi:DUF5005 domain-containing protein [Actinopolymorpha sp. B9G3]|uniref:DUF5005 domain-containing protein n=1 Tax=Actinopolymorpha sp. B9G3 TaxID=3158970 RepID=UPI0032D951ED